MSLWQGRALQLLRWLARVRYVKFGMVGASGTVVNMAVLYLCHNHVFDTLEADLGKPYVSLAVAIAVATMNNFSWNRLWTWADRRTHGAEQLPPAYLPQLLKYALASWFGIALQYGLTLWLAHFMHYLLANMLAIVVASVSNFFGQRPLDFQKAQPMTRLGAERSAPLSPWLLLLASLVLLYFFGLDSAYAPTNGDELVYVHIARATAQSGHWLPLASELDHMRNTKPPLLFWQAMVAGDWGRHWSMAVLRLPSVIYTLLTAALVAVLTRRISGSLRSACIAATLYLLFFSTFRYCRVYLSSAPETFWFGLPLFALLWMRTEDGGVQAAAASRRGTPPWLYLVAGVCFGIGALYKSFALIAPACASLWAAALVTAAAPRRRAVLAATLGAACSAAIGLAVFALWFWLDPDPAAVWREFVLGENTRKMDAALPYWQAALWGDDPVYKQLWAYPENAATLGLLVVGGMVSAARLAWQNRATQNPPPPVLNPLWLWPLVWLLVFAIPSQRDARYLIPAMPAIAMALALLWERIARGWFIATALVLAPAILVLARIAWVLGDSDMGSPLLLWANMLLALASLAAAATVLVVPRYSRTGSLWLCAGVYACLLTMTAPLDQPSAQFRTETQVAMAGKRIAVPNGFTGQFERFRFVLPGATVVPYDALGRNTGVLRPDMAGPQRLEFLLGQFDAVVWIVESDAQPECLPNCRVLDQRWFVKSRHKAGEVRLDNIAYPQQWLLGREFLVARGP